MMRRAACLIAIALAGCGGLQTMPTKPSDLTTTVETVTVNKPVLIPCVDEAEKPDIPPTNLRRPPPGLTDEQKLALYIEQLRLDINAWKVYGIRAEALLNSCIRKTVPAPTK